MIGFKMLIKGAIGVVVVIVLVVAQRVALRQPPDGDGRLR